MSDKTKITQHLVTVQVELTQDEAWDYANFLKRVGLSDYESNAQDKAEAYRMLAVGEKFRAALADSGFAPR